MHRFKELFGYEVLNAQRRERTEQLMAEAGIEEAKRDDWLDMSMPAEVPVPETGPDPALTPEWFAHMANVHTDSEREVEMHFASPLFRGGLGPTKRRLPIRYSFLLTSTMAFISQEIIPTFDEEIRYTNADCC